MPRPPAQAGRPRVHAAPPRRQLSLDSATLAIRAVRLRESGVFSAASRLRACKEVMNDVKSLLVQLEDTLRRTEASLNVATVRNMSPLSIAQLARRLRTSVEVRENDKATQIFNLRETAIVVAKIEEGKEQRAREAQLQRSRSVPATSFAAHTKGLSSPSPGMMMMMPHTPGSPPQHTPHATPPAMPSLHAPQPAYAAHTTVAIPGDYRNASAQPWGPHMPASSPQQQQQQQQRTSPQGPMHVNAVTPACALRPL